MKLSSKYLWAYLLGAGVILMFLPSIFFVGATFEDGSQTSMMSVIGILELFSFPLILIGGILGIVQLVSKSNTATPAMPTLNPDGSIAANPVVPQTKSNTGIWAGVVTMLVGAFIAVLPLLVATFSTTNGHNMWDESDPSSGAAAIWLLMITIPVGGVVGLVGLIVLIVAAARKVN
jgi:hypothetical protein